MEEEEVEIINIQRTNTEIEDDEVYHSQKESDGLSYKTPHSVAKKYYVTSNIVNFNITGDDTIELDSESYDTIYVSSSTFITAVRLTVGCIGVGREIALVSNPDGGESRVYFGSGTSARTENNGYSSNILIIEQGKTISITAESDNTFIVVGSVTNA